MREAANLPAMRSAIATSVAGHLTRLFVTLLVVQFGMATFAGAADQDAAERRACDSVIAVATVLNLAHQTSGQYHCESVNEFSDNAYFIVNLKYWSPTVPKDFVGSNLVGWFAVRKSDLAVYEVNADGDPGIRIEASRKARKPGHVVRRHSQFKTVAHEFCA